MRLHVLGLFVALAGCGNDGGGAIPIDDLANTEISDICNLYVQCGVFTDAQMCRDSLFLNLSNVDDLVAAVKAGKVIYDGNKARECLDALVGTSCDRRDVFFNRNTPAACDQTFVGTVGDAGVCELDQECISQDCNVPTCPAQMCCAGACVGGTAPVRGHIGQACSATMRCLEGYCNPQSMVCEAYLADGAPCTSSQSCDSDVCVTTCQALVPSGGACSNTQFCENIGETCLTSTMTCGKGGGVGATCTASADCAVTLACDVAGTKTCISRPSVGESCATIGSCLDNAFCDTTTKLCTARKADGSACQSSNECASNRCDTVTTHQCYTPPVCI